MKSLASQALERIGKDWSTGKGTREAKLQTITRFAEFVETKFGLERIDNLKPGHVSAYAAQLHADGIGQRTGANYMAFVRDVAASIGKANIVERDNAAYGFGGVSRQNPLQQNNDKVNVIKMGLEAKATAGDRLATMMTATAAMRAEFGLRQKEALLSHKVEMVDGKECLRVEGAKGGLERHIPIRTGEQRAALELRDKTASGLGSGTGRCIPPEMSLKTALQKETKAWHAAGGTRTDSANMHAARHEYAQGRLLEGATRAEVNKELGHGEQRSLGSYSK